MFNRNNTGNNRTEWPVISNNSSEHVGYYLKKARERMGLSLEHISEEICVRRIYLRAIEEGYYGDLPGTAYAVGFVRNYAKYLGLDDIRVVEQFRIESNTQQTEVELEAPIAVESKSRPRYAIIVVGLLLAVFATIFYVLDKNEFPIKDTLNEAYQTFFKKKDKALPSSNPSIQGEEKATGQDKKNSLSSDINIKTIEQLLGSGKNNGQNDTTSNIITNQSVKKGAIINQYELPLNRSLTGWRRLSSIEIASKPQNLVLGGDNIENIVNSVKVAKENQTGVKTVQNQASPTPVSQVKVSTEPKIRLIATDDSYIYVFKENGGEELKIGSLKQGESYVVPEGEHFLLTFVGNITAILDGKTKLILMPTGGKSQLYSYDILAKQALLQ